MKTVQIALALLLLISSHSLQAQNKFAEKAAEQMAVGAYAQAVDSWSRAISLDANNEEYYFKRGYSYLKLNRIDNALLDFTSAIQNENKNPEYMYYRGLCYFEKGDYTNALWNLEDALKLDPKHLDCFLYKIKTLSALNRYRDGIEDCRKMLKNGDTENPNPEILVQRALLYQKQNIPESAARDIKDVLKMSFNNPRVYAGLGAYYQTLKEDIHAVKAYSQAHELDKANLHYLYEWAYLLLQTQDNGGAFAKSTKLMQNANTPQLFPKGLIVKATSAAMLNNTSAYENAVKDFNSVAKNNDDFVFAAQVFSHYLFKKYPEGVEQAKEWAVKAQRFDDSYTTNLLLAQIYFKLDETTLAQETAKRANTMLQKMKGMEGEKEVVANLLTQIETTKLDKTAPTLSITSPVSDMRGGVIVEEVNEIIVVGFARDDSGIDKVLINGNIAKLNADNSFEGKTVLQSENTTILIQAFDKRGNEQQRSLTIEKTKTTPPPAKNDLALVSTNGKNHAILFGNNEYKYWGQLYNPIGDARALAKDLETIYGFTTEVVENCTKNEFLLKIREYSKKNYADNDQLLIFYAGHGHFDNFYKGVLVMKDSEYKAETSGSYITHAELRSFISSIPCKHTLYIADACFGGTIDPKIANRGGKDIFKNRQDYVSRIMSYTTRKYLTSGGKEYVPDGKQGGHSPFMRRLLEALRSEGGEDGILTLEEIESYLTDIKPVPCTGELESNDPGSNFIFIKQ